jgi:transcriptional regulator with XRE-family HTH domain
MTHVEGIERRSAFCARLKAERERRGTSIRTIAEKTKVKASLLEELEHGNVSHWPKGIYRRSFFRDYVTGIGLPVDPYTSEFAELFPDEDDGLLSSEPVVARTPVNGMAAMMRLTLAEGVEPADSTGGRWNRLRRRAGLVPMRALAALLDLALVMALTFPISILLAVRLDFTTAIVACAYYSVSTLLLGRSGAWWGLAQLRRFAASKALASGAAGSAVRAAAAGSRSSTPELRNLVSQAFRARSAVREYLGRLSGPTVLTGGSDRRRDLAGVRRHRVETPTRTAADDLVR